MIDFVIFFAGLLRPWTKHRPRPGIFCKARLRCFPAKRPSLRSLLSNVKYKIDNNSKTKNHTKKTQTASYFFTRYETLHSSFFLAHYASFMSKLPFLRGGGASVCRSVVGTGPGNGATQSATCCTIYKRV